jgi:uncharacterized protein (DUF58 family)
MLKKIQLKNTIKLKTPTAFLLIALLFVISPGCGGKMGLGATLYRLRWRLFVFLVLSYAIAITIYLLPHHETRPFSIPRPPKRAPPP